eukprot:CAMPEP_0183294702 /NCGR_PEP_ID=MMETSP0160_2-20130417/2929_1 /TAXON_ID=2839 ORGANISM="Odontella Sinensis, Strain Grunow 1884" /NCGR_SAMPLE_ID=MMETSP0160_2 /ASSEMBLY_ACC=CAM_ASM_000250 /LENGTH=251 /DNA_ID=CAMNT_0025456061 /DNA_START=9 /DNA_END=764 /DNA_ORIENTATION=+
MTISEKNRWLIAEAKKDLGLEFSPKNQWLLEEAKRDFDWACNVLMCGDVDDVREENELLAPELNATARESTHAPVNSAAVASTDVGCVRNTTLASAEPAEVASILNKARKYAMDIAETRGSKKLFVQAEAKAAKESIAQRREAQASAILHAKSLDELAHSSSVKAMDDADRALEAADEYIAKMQVESALSDIEKYMMDEGPGAKLPPRLPIRSPRTAPINKVRSAGITGHRSARRPNARRSHRLVRISSAE